MVSSTDAVSLGSAGCAVMTSAGPWPCALGSAFPLFAPLITWRGTVACCLLRYGGELLLRAPAGSVSPSAVCFVVERLGIDGC